MFPPWELPSVSAPHRHPGAEEASRGAEEASRVTVGTDGQSFLRTALRGAKKEE